MKKKVTFKIPDVCNGHLVVPDVWLVQVDAASSCEHVAIIPPISFFSVKLILRYSYDFIDKYEMC